MAINSSTVALVAVSLVFYMAYSNSQKTSTGSVTKIDINALNYSLDSPATVCINTDSIQNESIIAFAAQSNSTLEPLLNFYVEGSPLAFCGSLGEYGSLSIYLPYHNGQRQLFNPNDLNANIIKLLNDTRYRANSVIKTGNATSNREAG